MKKIPELLKIYEDKHAPKPIKEGYDLTTFKGLKSFLIKSSKINFQYNKNLDLLKYYSKKQNAQVDEIINIYEELIILSNNLFQQALEFKPVIVERLTGIVLEPHKSKRKNRVLRKLGITIAKDKATGKKD